jgi:PAS domain-containing protein
MRKAVAKNISDKKEVENSLIFAVATLEASPEGILVLDPDGKILITNLSLKTLWEIPEAVQKSKDREQLISFLLKKIVEPKGFAKDFKQLQQSPEIRNFAEICTNDGKIFECFSAPLFSDGQFIGRSWSFRDVSEIKRAAFLRTINQRISEITLSARDFETFYSEIHSIIKEITPADNFSILLYNSNSDMLTFPYSVDEQCAFPSARKSVNDLYGLVLRSGKAMLITGKQANKRRAKGDIEFEGNPAAIWLGVPFMHDGEVFGSEGLS